MRDKNVDSCAVDTGDFCMVPRNKLRRWREAGGRRACFYMVHSEAVSSPLSFRWFYVLESFERPEDPSSWLSGARAYGPFAAAYDAVQHLAAGRHGFPPFVSSVADPSWELPEELQALIKAATLESPE